MHNSKEKKKETTQMSINDEEINKWQYTFTTEHLASREKARRYRCTLRSGGSVKGVTLTGKETTEGHGYGPLCTNSLCRDREQAISCWGLEARGWGVTAPGQRPS